MNKAVNLSEFSDILIEVLNSGGTVKIKAEGNSMYPTIREKSDVLTLVKPPKNIRVNSIALFVRKNGKAVLHRVIKLQDDYVVLRGDNQWTREKVKKDEIIAVLKSVERNGKEINFDKFDLILPLMRWSKRICNKIRR